MRGRKAANEPTQNKFLNTYHFILTNFYGIWNWTVKYVADANWFLKGVNVLEGVIARVGMVEF